MDVRRLGHGRGRRAAQSELAVARSRCAAQQTRHENTGGHQRAHTHRAEARAQPQDHEAPLLRAHQGRDVSERRRAQPALS